MIPDRVETSINLIDNVSPACENIVKSLEKVLKVYDDVSNKMSNASINNFFNNKTYLLNNNYEQKIKYYDDIIFSKRERYLKQKEAEEKRIQRIKEKQMLQKATAEARLRMKEEKIVSLSNPTYVSARDKMRQAIEQDYKNTYYNHINEKMREAIEQDYKNNNNYNHTNEGMLKIYNGIGTLTTKLIRQLSIENIKKAIDLSDNLSQVRTKIDMLNQSFNEKNGTDYTTDNFMDYIYKSAQNARVGYYDMANTIASVGMYSSDVFDNQKETVAFTNLLYKVLRTNGMNSEDASGGVKQVINLINIGELKSQQLLALLKQAPSITSMVTKTLKITEQELEEMVKKSRISARAIKDIMLINIDEINKKFAEIPMTWRDVVTQIENILLKTFEPSLKVINKFANNKEFVDKLKNTVARIGVFISRITSFFIVLIDILSSCWNVIEPLLYGIVISITVDLAQKAVSSLVSIFKTLFALFTNPYVLGILATAYALGLLYSNINNLGDSAISTSNSVKKSEDSLTGFLNVLKVVIDCTLGILEGVFAMILYGLKNIIEGTIGFFYSLGDAILKFIKSPFEGIIADAKWIWGSITGNEKLKKESDELAASGVNDFNFMKNYHEAFSNSGIWDYDYYDKYGLQDVFDDAFKKASGMNDKKSTEIDKIATNQYYSQLDDIKKYIEDLKKEMEKSNESLEITSEDLKYMMDIAERDAINRFTTAEIKVEMQNNNNINNNMDIDGIVDYLASGIEEAMYVAAEGVY